MSLITSEKKFSNPKKPCKHFMSLLHPKLSCFHPTRWRNPVTHHHHHHHHYHYNRDHNSRHDHQHYLHGHPPRKQLASHSHLGVYSKECMIERRVNDDHHQDHDSDGDDDDDYDDDHGVGKVQMHEVDAKAEAFIENFKQVLRLERQKSVEEFYAMLARGT